MMKRRSNRKHWHVSAQGTSDIHCRQSTQLLPSVLWACPSRQVWIRDLSEDKAPHLVLFADSTNIPPPLGQFQSPWGSRTALGHLMGNKSSCERRGRTGRRVKAISMIRQGKEGQDRNKSCSRGKTSTKGKIKQSRKDLQFWNCIAKLKNTFCVKYILMAPWVVAPRTISVSLCLVENRYRYHYSSKINNFVYFLSGLKSIRN